MNNKELRDSIANYFIDEHFTGEQRAQIADYIHDTFVIANRTINSIDDLTDEEFEQVVDFADSNF